MYEAKVLADSVSGDGNRLMTIQATFPRFILAEVNTHRMFSRNSASSRAIPPEKLIARVRDHPFVPETFNKRVKGMGIGEVVDDLDAVASREAWLMARDAACDAAQNLIDLDIDKSRTNRLLEPFMWHTAIISSTEWNNFFSLRCPPGDEATGDFPAQYEFQRIAILMREAMRASKPNWVAYGSWHLPLVKASEVFPDGMGENAGEQTNWLRWAMISAGRCARVSYDTHENFEEPQVSYDRAEKLRDNGHLSPFEHVAQPMHDATRYYGNFRGWRQLRADIPYEKDRVGHLEGRKSWDEGISVLA